MDKDTVLDFTCFSRSRTLEGPRPAAARRQLRPTAHTARDAEDVVELNL